MNKKILRPGAVSILLIAAETPFASALCGSPKLRVDDEFLRSTAIFVGTPISEKHLPNDNNWLETVYTVRPSTWVWVNLWGVIVMKTSNDSGRFELTVGKPNLIFVEKGKDGTYFADNCGNTGLLKDSLSVLKEVRGLPHAGVSYLYGGCINGDCEGGVAIAESRSGRWQARIDSRGDFTMRVPPGHYRVRIELAGSKFAGYELSYNPPDNVFVPDGGSGGVAFMRGH